LNLLARFHGRSKQGLSCAPIYDAQRWQTSAGIHQVVPAGCVTSGAALPSSAATFPSVDAGQSSYTCAKTGTRIEETARLCDLVETDIRAV
jgi:hypothetical protein